MLQLQVLGMVLYIMVKIQDFIKSKVKVEVQLQKEQTETQVDQVVVVVISPLALLYMMVAQVLVVKEKPVEML